MFPLTFGAIHSAKVARFRSINWRDCLPSLDLNGT